MERSLFIGWVILAVAFSYGCTKKQNLPEKQSTEAVVSVQNNDSMNIGAANSRATSADVTVQNNDSLNRKMKSQMMRRILMKKQMMKMLRLSFQ